MSALEMAANGERISVGAAQKIDEAIAEVLMAQRLVAQLQDGCEVGDSLWHRLETIDDRLHDALSKLGN